MIDLSKAPFFICQAVMLSIIIIAIQNIFKQGQIFGWIRIAVANMLDAAVGKNWSCFIQKPIWCCISCMGGIWTVILTLKIDPVMILAVIGTNCILGNLINADDI